MSSGKGLASPSAKPLSCCAWAKGHRSVAQSAKGLIGDITTLLISVIISELFTDSSGLRYVIMITTQSLFPSEVAVCFTETAILVKHVFSYSTGCLPHNV